MHILQVSIFVTSPDCNRYLNIHHKNIVTTMPFSTGAEEDSKKQHKPFTFDETDDDEYGEMIAG
jgi:hypothetical protein